MNAALVYGTRPEIIKCVPLIRKYKDLTLINTGQHYDFDMHGRFIDAFDLPEAHYNLGVGSGTHAEHLSKIQVRLEKVLLELKPDLIIVPGDTDTALSGSITASKISIPIVHLESGLRSYDPFMPEEINRKVIDHIAHILFAPTQLAYNNLLVENIPIDHLHMTGDTMYELYTMEHDRIKATDVSEILDGIEGDYAILTIHRAENVENIERIKTLRQALSYQNRITYIMPMHPRTRKALQQSNLYDTFDTDYIKIVDPIGYHTMMKLLQSAQFVITDSGGLQKEAFFTKTPCLTYRTSTEWLETIKYDGNKLLQGDLPDLTKTLTQTINNRTHIIEMIENAPRWFALGNTIPTEIILETLGKYSLIAHKGSLINK